MDNQRIILSALLAAVVFLMYQAWVQDFSTPATIASQHQSTTPTAISAPNNSDVPNAAPAGSIPAQRPSTESSSAQAEVGTVHVKTDLLEVDISLQGGSLVNVWLNNYAVDPSLPNQKFQLLKANDPNLFVAQSGLLGDNTNLPTHTAIYNSSASSYELGNNDQLQVVLTWQGENNIEVKKTYQFTRGSYLVKVNQEVINHSDKEVKASEYNQLQRTPLNDPHEPRFVYTYKEGVYYTPEDKYNKYAFKDMAKKPLSVKTNEGWVAMIQHYFFGAWIPPQGQSSHFYTNKIADQERYIIGTQSPMVTIAPNASHTFSDGLYVGPKIQEQLENIAPGLELTVDYGWLTVIAKPIFWVLSWIHSWVGNWGWSIILLTILIKLIFFKLSATSYRSMANMRNLAPRLKALKDRYGDDKQRLNQAMMEMYKTEKINPLGGCLPVLVQIPVFIALYWVLLDSVEMRHAPFMLWLNNLSAPDPYFILPLLMGISMFVQQKLSPQPPDPMQAKIMMTLPIVFTVFFAFFPAGLVLYWTVNNIISIAQQWFITRGLEKEAEKKRR